IRPGGCGEGTASELASGVEDRRTVVAGSSDYCELWYDRRATEGVTGGSAAI
ncbi:unnamed protein product, partial [Nesidiocoris tenuis]